MASVAPRRRARARLAVTVTTPDGERVSGRGLSAWLSKAAPATARGEVTVALVSDARMCTLNRVFRGKDYATDVLSFASEGEGTSGTRVPPHTNKTGGAKGPPYTIKDSNYLGDIVIATGVAERQADEAGHPVLTELKILALHGLLHLLGYDHERDEGLMSRTEARLRKRAGLVEGLIERRTRSRR